MLANALFETAHLDLSTKVGNYCPKCLLNDHEKCTVLMQNNEAQNIIWMAKFRYRSIIKTSDILLWEDQERTICSIWNRTIYVSMYVDVRLCVCMCIYTTHTLKSTMTSIRTYIFLFTVAYVCEILTAVHLNWPKSKLMSRILQLEQPLSVCFFNIGFQIASNTAPNLLMTLLKAFSCHVGVHCKSTCAPIVTQYSNALHWPRRLATYPIASKWLRKLRILFAF